MPARQPTVPAVTFLKLFSGQPLEIQVSQSLNSGKKGIRWARGAALTAKAEGLWTLRGPVSAEDVRHVQNRVWQFDASSALPDDSLKAVPKCKVSFCEWLLVSSERFAGRPVRVALQIPEDAEPVDS